MSKHVVVWLDHQEAHIFQIHPDHVDEASLPAPNHHHLKHPRAAAEAAAETATRFSQRTGCSDP